VPIDTLDHGGVEPGAGGEREPAVVHAPDVDRARLPDVGEPQQVLGGVDDLGGDAEHAAVHVRGAAGQAGERGVRAGEPVGGLVDGAVAAERHDDVVALRGRLAAQLDRVPLALRVDGLDGEPPLEGVHDEVLEPHRHRRGVGVDDDEHPARRRRRLEGGGVGQPLQSGGLRGGDHHEPRTLACRS
jgi:hypothetical protein